MVWWTASFCWPSSSVQSRGFSSGRCAGRKARKVRLKNGSRDTACPIISICLKVSLRILKVYVEGCHVPVIFLSCSVMKGAWHPAELLQSFLKCSSCQNPLSNMYSCWYLFLVFVRCEIYICGFNCQVHLGYVHKYMSSFLNGVFPAFVLKKKFSLHIKSHCDACWACRTNRQRWKPFMLHSHQTRNDNKSICVNKLH